MEKDLTQLEILHLPETFNLTDGHAHRRLNPSEQAIADAMVPMFQEVEREQQRVLEKAYVDAFYDLMHQTVDYDQTRYLLLPSASISLEVVANYLRLAGLDLALIEPCFDNLANMFKRHGVALEPIPEMILEAEPAAFEHALQGLHGKALCIVSPNNPTGVSYSPEIFRRLVEFCKRHGRLLILDTSFRAYKEDEHIFDEYALLQQSGIDYMVIEDTGKSWPTKEMKVSILAVSQSIYKDVFNIYTDFIYHHSPFVVRLLTAFVHNSRADHLQGVKDIVRQNRNVLYAGLAGTMLTPAEKPFASVAWLKIGGGKTALEVVRLLDRHGVFTLPGRQFYWSDERKGDGYIRVSLVRDPETFTRAVRVMAEALKQ